LLGVRQSTIDSSVSFAERQVMLGRDVFTGTHVSRVPQRVFRPV